MGVILDTTCAACGTRHVLLLEKTKTGRLDQSYEYHCPVASTPVRLAELPNDWWKTVDDRPEGAISLRPV